MEAILFARYYTDSIDSNGMVRRQKTLRLQVFFCPLRLAAGEGGCELAAVAGHPRHLRLHRQEGAAAGALGQVLRQ